MSSGNGRTGTQDGDLHPAVSIRNVSKRYQSGNREVVALDDVSIEIPRGTVTGILGPNGAGKTTLVKCLLGLVEPTEGTVRVAGHDLHEETRAVHGDVAAVLEGSRNVYWRLSVAENVRFFAAVAGLDPTSRRAFHEELLERFDLADERDRPVRELSRGQKQKASIVCALAREPEVIYLDEPTLGLDVPSSHALRAEIDRLARDRGLTILVASHDMDVVEDICKGLFILIDGRVVVSTTVEDLLGRFSVQAYEVTVAGSLSERRRDSLADQIGARDFEERRSGTRFRFETDREAFFETVDRLAAHDVTVERFDAVETDLEDVFVDITEGSTTADPPLPGDRS